MAIRHADGSAAGYGHTQQNGAVVGVGVFPSVVWRRTDDILFNFRNADGQADSRGALAVRTTYRALFYEPSASPLAAR